MPEKVWPLVMAIACADALGAPYEYSHARGEYKAEWTSSEETGGGCLSPLRPSGTWTDDTALTLAEMESLAICNGFDQDDMVYRFRGYLDNGDFSPFGHCDDVGVTCRIAIRSGIGVRTGSSHGNGSLMRIAPLALTDASVDDVESISAVTHADDVPMGACAAFVRVLRFIAEGRDMINAVNFVSVSSDDYCEQAAKYMLLGMHYGPDEDNSGEVLRTLRNAAWCAYSNDMDYRRSVVAAAELGGDTDTVAVVTAALTAIGKDDGEGFIPVEWYQDLVGKGFIYKVCSDFGGMQ